MKLYLMRHGEALSSQEDPERGLSDNGKLKITLLAEHLKQKGLMFKHIYHSEKLRAKQTAEMVAKIVSPEVQIKLLQNILPTDDPILIFDEINSWTEDSLVATHLPFIPNLISLLTGQDAFLTSISFETGTVVCLDKKSDTRWKINWTTSPSEISHL
jgi:phosphohistidine phosphatase